MNYYPWHNKPVLRRPLEPKRANPQRSERLPMLTTTVDASLAVEMLPELALAPVDFRRGIDGLMRCVVSAWAAPPSTRRSTAFVTVALPPCGCWSTMARAIYAPSACRRGTSGAGRAAASRPACPSGVGYSQTHVSQHQSNRARYGGTDRNTYHLRPVSAIQILDESLTRRINQHPAEHKTRKSLYG